MSNANQANDEVTFDKLIATRVDSKLINRIETLSEETISDEVRAGLRLRRLELEEKHNQLRTDGGRDVARDERRSLVPVATKNCKVHDAAADVAHDAVEHGDLDPAEVADALRAAADEVERTDVGDDLVTDGGLAVGATHVGPHTAPPVARFGERLSRYAEYLAEPCPECGEVGIDVWLNEGATVARGVCVACDSSLDGDQLDDVVGGDSE